jgi:hypothetical protein
MLASRRAAWAALLLSAVRTACLWEVKVLPRLAGPATPPRGGGSTVPGPEGSEGGGQSGACGREGGAARETWTTKLPACVARGELTTRGSHARAGEQGGQHPDAHMDGFVLNSVLVHLEHADGRVEVHRRMMQFDDHPHLDPNVPREVCPAPSRAGARQPAQRVPGRDSSQKAQYPCDD